MIIADDRSFSFKHTSEVEAFSKWYLSAQPPDVAEFREDELREFMAKRALMLQAQLIQLSDLNISTCIDTDIREQSYYRIVPETASKPLSAEGSTRSSSRFNYKKLPLFHNRAVYLGQDRECCYHEKFHLDIQRANYAKLFDRTPEQQEQELPRPRYVLKEFKIRDVNKVAVLTSDATFKALGIPSNVARDEWYPVNDQWDIPTAGQVLARILRGEGFSGVMYTSVRVQSKHNLVLFEEVLGQLAFEEVSSVDLDLA